MAVYLSLTKVRRTVRSDRLRYGRRTIQYQIRRLYDFQKVSWLAGQKAAPFSYLWSRDPLGELPVSNRL